MKRPHLFRTPRTVRCTSKRAFTLIEVMMTTAILALGAVLISEAFFVSLNAFGYCDDYLRILTRADEKVWEAQDILTRLGPSASLQASGLFPEGGKDFRWSLSHTALLDAKQASLYKIDLHISWQEGRRDVKLARAGYALFKKKE